VSESAQLELRRAGPKDAPELRRMLHGLMAQAGSSAQPIKVAALAHHMSGFRPQIEAVIAAREGRAVGMVLFFPWLSTWRGQLYLYVQDLYVEAAERGSGIGRELLAAAAREGRARGCRSLLLALKTSNTAAARFYKRLGFRCLEEERLWLMPPTALERLIGWRSSSLEPEGPSPGRNNRGGRRLR
jgi:ribosomal protein S18 acetylase RimI-like enzyme